MKVGNKRATKLFDTKEEAEAYKNDGDSNTFYVEEREKIYNRCENYCDCYEFCVQANKLAIYRGVLKE